MTPRSTTPAPDPSRICTARSKRTGKPCRAAAIRGSNVCRMHGGGAPQVEKAAMRRVARDEAVAFASREAARLGEAWIDTDPLDGLLRLYQEAEWNVAVYRSAISRLIPDVDTSGAIAIAEQVVYFEKGGTHVPAMTHILVAMYDQERDRAAKYAKFCIDAGVDVKRVQLEAAKIDGYVGRMTAGLDAYRVAAGVDEQAHAAGLAAMADRMRRTA